MQNQAIKYLSEERMLNICMIEAIRRGNAEILSAERGAVLLQEKNSRVYMLYARDYTPGAALLEQLAGREDLRELSVTRADLSRKAQELLGMKQDFEYYHVAYLEDRPPKMDDRVEIHAPSEELADTIAANYEYLNRDQVVEHIREGHLFGGFVGGELVGFIGEHPEGSIGILEVLPAFRRHGYAYDLESFMIARHYNQGKVPFAQIFTDNDKSLSLQRKLGMTQAEQSCFWLSRR